MKALSHILTLLFLIGAFILTGCDEKQTEEGNVRHSAEWFFASMASGNEMGMVLHIENMAMSEEEFTKALKEKGSIISKTNFDDCKVSFEKEDGIRLAVLSLPENGKIRMHQSVKKHWTLYDIK